MSAGKQCKEAMQKLRLAEFERDQAVLRAARTEAERARAEQFWASAQERAEKLEAERDALREKNQRVVAALRDEIANYDREQIAQAQRVERAEAALREIEQATEGIPEQNCMLANRIARLALRDTAPKPAGPTAEEAERCRKASGPCTCGAHITGLGDWSDTAPAEEPRGYAPTDALGDARAEAAEPRCVRCGSRYSPGGACSRSAEGCQGGRGEWTVCIPPACPHGHPPGSARDCACHEEKPC